MNTETPKADTPKKTQKTVAITLKVDVWFEDGRHTAGETLEAPVSVARPLLKAGKAEQPLPEDD